MNTRIPSAKRAALAELQPRLRQGGRYSPETAAPVQSTGCNALDALFPACGIRPGSLVEWIGSGPAGGAATVSLLVSCRLNATRPPMLLIDADRHIYPVTLAAFGFELSRLVFVRPSSEPQALWACEEALRCPAIGVVWAKLERLAPTAFRRLQLAAEESGGIGFLVRPAGALREPSWADIRLHVIPRPAADDSPRFEIRAVYIQGTPRRSTTEITLDQLVGGSESRPANDDFPAPAATNLADAEDTDLSEQVLTGTRHDVGEKNITNFVPVAFQLARPTTPDLPAGIAPCRAADHGPHSTWRLRVLH